MSETTPQDQMAPQPERDSGTGRVRAGMIRIAVWTIASLALLGYLAFGSVSATWYRYNALTQRTNRQGEQRGIVEIWTDWMNDLPEAAGEWLLGAVYLGAIAVVIVAVVSGSWLLLVSSGDLHPRAARRRR